eukprot:2560501-Amphidinium_carterae.1
MDTAKSWQIGSFVFLHSLQPPRGNISNWFQLWGKIGIGSWGGMGVDPRFRKYIWSTGFALRKHLRATASMWPLPLYSYT